MVRPVFLLVTCGLVVAAGCLGGPGGPAGQPPPTATPPATTIPPATATPLPPLALTARAVGERAIAAEQDRIERKADEYETLTGLGFGILVPAEYAVARRNDTGVVVRVTVGYSLETDCDRDGEPESSSDGATTEATYFVTEERVHLLAVSDDFHPEQYC